MATSGSANLVYTGQQLVTESLHGIKMRVVDDAESYTAESVIVAAGLRRIGVHNGNITETYTDPGDIVSRAQAEIGDHNPTAARTTRANNILSQLAKAWARHGMTLSSGTYPGQWEDALVSNVAVRLAPQIGRPVPQHLSAWAAQSYAECLRHPVADMDTNAAQILTELTDSWAQYGMELSSSQYPNRWVAALTNEFARRMAYELRIPVPEGLDELAASTLAEARSFTKIDSGLNKLNMLLMSWNGLGIRVWARKSKTITLSADKASYTVGESGKDVTMTVPMRILTAMLRDSDGNDTPLKIYTPAEWAGLPDKDDTGETVGIFYDRALNAETIYVWPVVEASGYSLVLTFQARLEEFDAITDDVFCSPEWYAAIVANLSLPLAPQYEKPVTPAMVKLAQETFAIALGAAREIPRQPLVGWPNDA